ncbi:hypothetical protein EJB05_06481 [Eragrostis curvula]|uniref:Uncharacterized protein n=1 Tax=Eragrostis curvula TaxID=38414 RepID=A0A5J9WFC1_9POAL|nr:hypothetical protein EJB05_06481 [Eragrostis curvula]
MAGDKSSGKKMNSEPNGDEEDAKAAKKHEQTRDRTRRWLKRLKDYCQTASIMTQCFGRAIMALLSHRKAGCKENQSLEKHGDTRIKRKKNDQTTVSVISEPGPTQRLV